MSSFKRIPKSAIQHSKQNLIYNGKKMMEEELYKKTNLQEYIDESRKKIKEEEQNMLIEIEQRKEMLLKEAFEKAYDQGKGEIRAEIEEEMSHMIGEAKNEYEKANQFFRNILREKEEIKNEFIQEKKEDIISLAVHLAEKMIEQQITIEPEKMMELFEKARNEIEYETKTILVRIHPDAKDLIDKSKKEESDQRIKFMPDSSLKFYDYIIETDREFIDKKITTQLETMKEYLRGVLND